jgi:hypothetical protein
MYVGDEREGTERIEPDATPWPLTHSCEYLVEGGDMEEAPSIDVSEDEASYTWPAAAHRFEHEDDDAREADEHAQHEDGHLPYMAGTWT